MQEKLEKILMLGMAVGSQTMKELRSSFSFRSLHNGAVILLESYLQ